MSALDLRVRPLVDRPPQSGDWVLYWMIAARRPGWNFGLQRAVHWARTLGRPLVVLEPLRIGYRWASDRHHRFIIDGMVDNAAAFAGRGVTYLPYVEPEQGAGQGLLAALADRAAVVVTDDSPMFFYPRMLQAAAGQVGARFEAVDSNGLLPLAAAPRAYPRAFSFRRALQKNLPAFFDDWPAADPLDGPPLAPLDPAALDGITTRWPMRAPAELARSVAIESELSIDHSVGVVSTIGGWSAGEARMTTFLDERLERYGADRSKPEIAAASGLSPYLHYGHVGAHQVFAGVADRERWSPARISPKVTGQRHGWWGMSETAEAFLDELVTWRELGYQFCHAQPGYDRFDSLPAWALTTLAEHRGDPRTPSYTPAEFEAAETHDPLWNAAQNQLRREGVIHNYLRMLWGKKILHWSRTPELALEIMIHLNNKWSIDGRDPNSYSGIFWVLGRFDRAWGPVRPVFGKIRYMTSASTRRKFKVDRYIAEYATVDGGQLRLGS